MSKNARGMSLIEVLVSLVILSLGVLAVVALQLVASRNNIDAGQRTTAAQLAYSILERMRYNSTPTSLANYQTAANAPLGRGSLGQTEPTPTCTNGNSCTESQLVTHDLWAWEQSLDGAAEQIAGSKAGGLFQPTACIVGPNPAGDGVYTVTIVWRGKAKIPDDPNGPTCGRDPQPDGSVLYSETGNDNIYRRTISMPVYITARRR